MGSERRRSVRIQEPGLPRRGLLKCAGMEIPVTLLDESAGGFCVLSDQRPGVRVGDVGQLCIESGSYEVRVAHVRPPALVSRIAGQSGGKTRRKYQVGLNRLGVLEVNDGQEEDAGWLERFWPRGRQGSGSPMSLSTIALALMVAALPVAATVGVFAVSDGSAVKRYVQRGDSSDGKLQSGADSQPENRPVKQRNPQGAHESAASRGGSWFTGSSSPRNVRSSEAARTATNSLDQLRTAIQRLSGASVFLLEQVATKLKLTGEQKRQINQIDQDSFEAIRQIDERFAGASRQKRSQMRAVLLEKAQERALAVLTDQQRGYWDELQTPPPE